jgi:hypothetical protein
MLKGYEINSLHQERPRDPFESRKIEMRLGTAAKAALDVIAERERQKSVEGWTEAHDDLHVRERDLAYAAACYALAGTGLFMKDWLVQIIERLWPWEMCWWKPSDERRNLVKAGALILAEIERLDRAVLAKLSKGA